MYKNYIKRILDFVLALLAFIIALPVFLFVTLFLTIANNGKAFFFQERPGKDEKIFKVIKFKTMNDKRGNNGELLSDAERLTSIGKFIRKTSLDEIPQLINVIKGDMSLIGPRPLLVRYLPYYTEVEKRRHTVRPGITGLSQVNGRNLLSWNNRLNMDVFYVENISMKLDLKIVIKTIIGVISSKDIVVDATLIMKDFDEERKDNSKRI